MRTEITMHCLKSCYRQPQKDRIVHQPNAPNAPNDFVIKTSITIPCKNTVHAVTALMQVSSLNLNITFPVKVLYSVLV